jgi:hypothetical protein
MARSRKQQRKKKKRRFETAGPMILGQVRVGRSSQTRHSPFAIHPSRVAVRNVLLLLLVVVAVGALWLALDDRFYVYHADVVGVVRVSPGAVFQSSGLPGLHILWVRPDEVEARILAALPTIESAQVACGLHLPASGAGLPLRCTINVVERQPRVMWDEGGQLWWIDAEGVIFPASLSSPSMGGGGEGWLVRGPLPRGEDGWLDEPVRIALAELWAVSGAGNPPPGVGESASLDYVPGRGLVLTDERGWRVILGQGPGMDERLRVLERLVANLEARGLRPRFVDVRFADAPYYSLTNDW